MNQSTAFITGANGEIGHGLVSYLSERPNVQIVALDLKPLDASLKECCHEFIQGDILDVDLLKGLSARFEFDSIYHLASILSTKAEKDPQMAHRVNVEGTINLFQLALNQTSQTGRRVKFLYPSSIAVYGMPDRETKSREGRVAEDEWCWPKTMYGANKLYCEQLGRYFDSYYPRFSSEGDRPALDFRALRYPGLISATTVPTGGTSDYGPEMLHHAAQGLSYECFVDPDTRLPFMVMPDAIRAMIELESVPKDRLSQHVYNVTSFCPTAQEVELLVKRFFSDVSVDYVPHTGRQAIVDSWPEDIDDTAAAADWDWSPEFDQTKAFEDYLLPAIAERYGVQSPNS
jgi:nucleoside-diphosphate-sugar epimerase